MGEGGGGRQGVERNSAGEKDLACRATAAPPMGMVKGYK